MKRTAILTLLFAASLARTVTCQDWKMQVGKELKELGHRNWIVVADSAYPLQVSPGIETITVDQDQLSVVAEILSQISHAKHVRATIYTDSELSFVPEKDAKGVGAYRDSLAALLAKQGDHQTLLHEQIIQKLDEAGKTFKVLIIKTPLTIPYTSVFFQLNCGYWSDDAEQRLRKAMAASNK